MEEGEYEDACEMMIDAGGDGGELLNLRVTKPGDCSAKPNLLVAQGTAESNPTPDREGLTAIPSNDDE